MTHRRNDRHGAASLEGGVSPFVVGRTRDGERHDTDHVVYIRCPSCYGNIRPPFARSSGPVPHVHQSRSGCGARLIVIPDPDGSAHLVREVLPNESLEDALHAALVQFGGAA